jgi:hypothetical protein
VAISTTAKLMPRPDSGSAGRGGRDPPADSLHRRRLRLLKQVVVERLLEDRRIDQADDVLEGAKPAVLPGDLGPSSTISRVTDVLATTTEAPGASVRGCAARTAD